VNRPVPGPRTRAARLVATLVAAAGLALACPAAAGAATPTPTPSWVVNGLSPQDQAFLVDLHRSDLVEIEAGRAASTLAVSTAVRSYGSRLVSDHTAMDADVRALAAKYRVTLPATASDEQLARLREVRATMGRGFDTAFLRQQIDGHTATLAGIQQELSSGQNPDVLGVARNAQPTVTDHLQTAQRLATPGATATPAVVRAGSGGQFAALGTERLADRLTIGGLLLLVLAAGLGLRARWAGRTVARAGAHR